MARTPDSHYDSNFGPSKLLNSPHQHVRSDHPTTQNFLKTQINAEDNIFDRTLLKLVPEGELNIYGS